MNPKRVVARLQEKAGLKSSYTKGPYKIRVKSQSGSTGDYVSISFSVQTKEDDPKKVKADLSDFFGKLYTRGNPDFVFRIRRKSGGFDCSVMVSERSYKKKFGSPDDTNTNYDSIGI